MMLGKIPQHVGVPERLPVAEGKFGNAVTARVSKLRVGAIGDFPPAVNEASAKIHILEPHRIKILIEAADALPRFTPDCETRSGGLVNELGLGVVQIQAAIVPVPRIPGPGPIYK